MNPYLINPGPKMLANGPRRPKKTRRITMARRKRRSRRLFGAALKAHQKRVRRGTRKTYRRRRKNPIAFNAPRKRRVYRKRSYRRNRVRHTVIRHHRSGGRVGGYRRKGTWVKRHWSNPFGLNLGPTGNTILTGVLGLAVLGVATMTSAYVARNTVDQVGVLQQRELNILSKALLAAGLIWATDKFILGGRVPPMVRAAAAMGLLAPAVSQAMNAYAPQLAAFMPLPAPAVPALAYGGRGMGAQLQVAAMSGIGSVLGAQLESDDDSVMSMF